MLYDEAAFIGLLRRFTSVDAVPANALRNQEPGVVAAVQSGLAEVDLDGVPSGSAGAYVAWLDSTTDAILAKLKVKVRVKVPPWGTVRKALNLFMRACICNYYLRPRYALDRVEGLAEIPLDSVVAKALKCEAGRGKLPQWPGLKRLRCEDHREFQEFAAELAKKLGLPARVYLDNHLWLENR